MKPTLVATLLVVVVLAGTAPAMATTFSFDALAPTNASTPLAISVGGVTASFNSPSGAGAFIAEDGSAFSTLGSSVLADDNFTPEELDIGFSTALAAINLGFATNDSGAATAVTLTELMNGAIVGSIAATGTLASSGLPEGTLSLSGSSFNAVRIIDANAGNEGFAIGAVSVAVPEPSTLLALGSGLLSLVLFRRRC